MDCSRAIHDQHLKKVVIPLKIVAVFEPSENSCRSSEQSGHSSEKKNSLSLAAGTASAQIGPPSEAVPTMPAG